MMWDDGTFFARFGHPTANPIPNKPMKWDITPSSKWDAPKTLPEFQALVAENKLKSENYRQGDLEDLVALGSRLVFDDFEIYPDEEKADKEWLYKAAPLLLESKEDLFPAAMQFLRLVNKEGKSNIEKMLNSGKMDELKEMLEELEEAEGKIPGGKKGGTGEESSNGVWNTWITESGKSKVPELGMLDVLTRAKAVQEKSFVVGTPKDKNQKTFLRKPSQFGFLSEESLCLEDDMFFQNFAEGKLEIVLPLKAVKEKQQLFLLLDKSGSMHRQTKMVASVRILDALFDQIIEGNTIVYFAYFVKGRETFRKIETQEDVDYFKSHIFQSPGGGDTFLGPILTTLSEEISSGVVDGFEVNTLTEVVILNDGEDYVAPITSKVPIHAFMLDKRNTQLEEVCKSSKGQAYYVNYSGDFLLL